MSSEVPITESGESVPGFDEIREPRTLSTRVPSLRGGAEVDRIEDVLPGL
jgi:hypothetical protein